MKPNIIQIVVTCLLFMVRIYSQPKLLMIQQVFRHGARYPIFTSPKDNSDIARQWTSVGQLTSQGKNMHYFLGKILYNKYWNQLFKGTPYQNMYNQTQFYVKSTDVNRTIQSVQSHLFGMLQALPPLQLPSSDFQYSLPAWTDSELFNQNVSDIWNIFQSGPVFHPTPIHVEKIGANRCDQGDFLRNFDEGSCPNQVYWKKQNMHSDQYKQVQKNQRVVKAVQALSKKLGEDVPFDKVYQWKDSQTCLKYLGYKYLQIFDDPQYSEIYDFIQVYSMYKQLYSQQQQIKAVSTNFIKHTLQNFRGKISKTYTPRILIYSAHDSTVGMVLAALNMTNTKCIIDHYFNNTNNSQTCIWQFPKYSTNVIFQLWQNLKQPTKVHQSPGDQSKRVSASGNSQYNIKISFNGKYRKIPICNYKLQCPFEQFEEWAQGFMVKNVAKQCGLISVDRNYYSIIFILIILIIILLFNLCYMRYKHQQTVAGDKQDQSPDKNHKQDKYIEHLDQKISER